VPLATGILYPVLSLLLSPMVSMLARAADFLGWPQVAEASHCVVTGAAVTGILAGAAADEKYILKNPTLNPDGSLDISATCGASTATMHLNGLTPNSSIEVVLVARVGGSNLCDRDDSQEGEFQCEADG
jgi:hypothetical protein